jgi:transcriptional regulator with XRE-family HTH domain
MPSDVPWLGLRLREARAARGLSVRALGEAVGVSASMISQIETGKSRPSVSTLYAITTALEISVEELFASPAQEGETQDGEKGAEPERAAASARLKSGPLVRPDQRAQLTLDSGVTWELLGDLPGRPFDFLRMTYPPGAHSSVTGGLMRHAGCEYGLLLSGELVLTLGFEEFRLRAGDSVSFESSIPHGYRNEGDEPAVGVWFVTEEPHRNIWTAAG